MVAAVGGRADRCDSDDVGELRRAAGRRGPGRRGPSPGSAPGRSATTRSGPFTPAPNFSARSCTPGTGSRPATPTSRRAGRGASTSPARRARRARRRRAGRGRRAPGRHRSDGLRGGRAGAAASAARSRAAKDPLADEASSAGVKVRAIEHGDGDADRADRAHHAQERDAGDVEGQQRDEDRRAGEDDGVAGRAVREADRLVHAVAFLELAAVAVDDEQRVVDADREPEHDPEHRRDRHHVDDARQRQRGEDADPDADAARSGSAARRR